MPIAKGGVRVDGLDSSPAVLDCYRRRIAELSAGTQDLIMLPRADTPDFSFDAPFRFIRCPFGYLLHLMTAKAQVTALRSIRAHRHPRGCFAVNFLSPDVFFVTEVAGTGPGGTRIHGDFLRAR
mgnify:CR=1 FL=1